MNNVPSNDAESAVTNNTASAAAAKTGESLAELTTCGEWLLSAGMYNDFPARRQEPTNVRSISWRGPRSLHCRRSQSGR